MSFDVRLNVTEQGKLEYESATTFGAIKRGILGSMERMIDQFEPGAFEYADAPVLMDLPASQEGESVQPVLALKTSVVQPLLIPDSRPSTKGGASEKPLRGSRC
jgi:hypothetical protein